MCDTNVKIVTPRIFILLSNVLDNKVGAEHAY